MRMPKTPEVKKENKKTPMIKKQSSKYAKEDDVKALVGCLIVCLGNIHLLHINSESYAEHEALGELHGCLYELTDCLAEQCVGLCGPITQVKDKYFSEPLKLVESLLEMACSCMTENKGFQATIDEIVILLNKTYYKLTRLK